ncbi:MAG: SMC family ATPase [Nitrososphaeraceae archaeon]
MKILSVEIENFKPFREIILPDCDTFGDGLFLICGKNSMGKSSLIEATLWGLFGEQLFDARKRSLLLKIGQNECRVQITFELGESIFLVIRKLNIRKSGNPTNKTQSFVSDATLLRKGKDGFSIIVSDPRKVNAEIERMLGMTSDIIEKTVYVRQKEVDRLSRADSVELRSLIATFFDLDEFDRIKDNLQDQSSSLQYSISSLRESVGAMNIRKKDLDEKEHEMRICRSKIASREQELSDRIRELSNIPSEDVLTRIRDVENKIDDAQRDLITINTRIDDMAKLIETRDSRLDRLRTSIYELTTKKNKTQKELNKLPSKESLQKVSKLEVQIFNTEEVIRNTITQSDHEFGFDPIEKPESILERHELAKKDKEAVESTIHSLSKNIEKLRERLSYNEAISNLKVNSIIHVERNDNCPVCNKPVEDKNRLILSIRNEVERTSLNADSINLELAEKMNNHYELELLATHNNKLESGLNSLLPSSHNLIQYRKELLSILLPFSSKSIQEFLRFFSFSSVNEMILAGTILESNLPDYDRQVSSLEAEVSDEIEQYARYEIQLSEEENKKDQTSNNLKNLEHELSQIYRDLSMESIDQLTRKNNSESIEKLITKRKVLEHSILDLREYVIQPLKELFSNLEMDISNRKAVISQLEAKESEVSQKENEIRHVKYLRGEIDGFISHYVVEGKLVEILKKATNFYLVPFTDSRYTIDKIYSITKRVKDRESHGLEISLFDARDNHIKSREQLSGGDETALGLALRIAISKLMGRIRPFRDSERQLPLLNLIIMDEPMASLDASRRSAIVNKLRQDKSFRQIFLISHTDNFFGECNSIFLDEAIAGQRRLTYRPLEA